MPYVNVFFAHLEQWIRVSTEFYLIYRSHSYKHHLQERVYLADCLHVKTVSDLFTDLAFQIKWTVSSLSFICLRYDLLAGDNLVIHLHASPPRWGRKVTAEWLNTVYQLDIVSERSYLKTVFKLLADKIECYWVYARVHSCQVDADIIQWQQETRWQKKKSKFVLHVLWKHTCFPVCNLFCHRNKFFSHLCYLLPWDTYSGQSHRNSRAPGKRLQWQYI